MNRLSERALGVRSWHNRIGQAESYGKKIERSMQDDFDQALIASLRGHILEIEELQVVPKRVSGCQNLSNRFDDLCRANLSL